jgi:gamma-butyrobetaine dioxygenase
VELHKVGAEPRRSADPEEAGRILDQDGVVILTGLGPEEEDAHQAAVAVFGDRLIHLPPGAEVQEAGGPLVRRPKGLTNEIRSECHTDGYAYGDKYPDFVLLLCSKHSEEGGESFLVDGYALLDQMAADPEFDWLPEALLSVPINQTEADMQPSLGTILTMSPKGRRMLLMANYQIQRPNEESADPARDKEMIEKWRANVWEATRQIPRFKLVAGEAYIIDNYRFFHGREAYSDQERLMWRLWIWTDECGFGLPSGDLHSDNRNALLTPS